MSVGVCICSTYSFFYHLHFRASTLNRIGDYTLQVTGEESYIHGQHELLSFKAIRRYALYITSGKEKMILHVYCNKLFKSSAILSMHHCMNRSITKGEQIHLSITKNPSVEIDYPPEFSVS